MKRKLIKFDVIHPVAYLEEKKKTWDDLESLSRAAYTERLIHLRSNYSDFYTYHLDPDEWEAEEYFLLDDDFLKKTAQELFGSRYPVQRLWKGTKKERLKFDAGKWHDHVVDQYIRKVNPDVIFVRSQPMPSRFWQQYRLNTLLVARLSARLPYNWHPNHWDLIYTDQPDFQKFFELHGVKTIINDQGFDTRIVEELIPHGKQYDTTFVGGLGTENFSQRTDFFNNIAEQLDFRWWGYWWEHGGDGRTMQDFPALHQTYQGLTSGLEMFQVFKDSRIVLNDYVDTANGIGFNQRMFEVMGVGAFLLTRQAPNFKDVFPNDVFVTYRDTADCLDKVAYFLKHEPEREEIAQNAQRFIEQHYDYSRITREFGEDLKVELHAKAQRR